ncbi:MAG TPA: hypothetical protein VHG72_11610 [Polyangia bacterium]|nr:hypothetical protein [Polyangia bacterium]
MTVFASCSLSQNGVDPPSDTFFYPSSAAMNTSDATGQWLFVANSNADLRFNDGTVAMANVGADLGTQLGAESDRVDRAGQWDACPQADYVNPLPRSDAPICCRDLQDANIINCDERRYVKSDATVRIGSFAGAMVWQPYCSDPCNATCSFDPTAGRFLIGVRGDTSLTWIDVMPPGSPGNPSATFPGLHCTAAAGAGPTASLDACDQQVLDTAPILNTEVGDTALSAVNLPDEPYTLQLDPGRGFLYIGHLAGNTSVQNTGGVSLFDVSQTAAVGPGTFPPAPFFIAPFASPFPPNTSGQFGITALTLHEPLGQEQGSVPVLFAASRYTTEVTSMVPIGPMVCSGDDNDDVIVPGGDTLTTGLTGSEISGVAFSDPQPLNPAPMEGPTYAFSQQAYTLQRTPPALVTFQIAINESGSATTPTPTSVIETCSSPTFLYKQSIGGDERLFVNCFDTGEVYVFDPSVPRLMTTFSVGRGPGGMVFDNARPVAYVINFTQNDISVVDLAPGSATQYHVVQRLGFPTVTPR